MPACLTHSLFSQAVREVLPNKIDMDLCAYAWGAQGPDFFFCHRYLPFWKGKSVAEYGDRLHRAAPSKVLGAMRSFLEKHPDPLYSSYIRGFVCHYSLDSIAHPYINWLAAQLVRQRPWETESTLHDQVESALEAIVLRAETGKLPSEVPLRKLFPKNEGVERKIARLYRYVLFGLYGEDVAEDLLVQAMDDTRKVFSLATDRTGVKRSLLSRLERGKPSSISSHIVPLTEEDDVDYANVGNTPWGGAGSCQSFFELYGEAQGLASEIINGFMDGDLGALTGERPFG